MAILLSRTQKHEISPSSPYIKDPKWQEFRKSLKQRPTEEKLQQLLQWHIQQKKSYASKVQITNYYNALARGGQVPPRKKA